MNVAVHPQLSVFARMRYLETFGNQSKCSIMSFSDWSWVLYLAPRSLSSVIYSQGSSVLSRPPLGVSYSCSLCGSILPPLSTHHVCSNLRGDGYCRHPFPQTERMGSMIASVSRRKRLPIPVTWRNLIGSLPAISGEVHWFQRCTFMIKFRSTSMSRLRSRCTPCHRPFLTCISLLRLHLTARTL